MSWHPIGPDSVMSPRDESYLRLSRRNNYGRQGLVQGIAIDPTDASTVYVTERPTSGGTSAFRTRDDGRSWTPIADSLQQSDPSIDPSCIAVNPDHPEIIYLGTLWNQSIYVSNNRGEPGSWSSAYAIGGRPTKLIVDPRTSSTPTTTVLYAATTAGVYRSPDGGVTWTQVLAGNVWTLVAFMPPTGTAHFYAGVYRSGVFYANNPISSSAWTNLSSAGIGLPAYAPATSTTPESFEVALVDLCPRNPTRAYAWLLRGGTSLSLYTTASPTSAWSNIAWISPPGPWYGYYAMSFAVAPNSPGDGLADIIIFGNGPILRSIDSGRTWRTDAVWYHADQHAIAFQPAQPPAGVIPTTYIGNDGGIAKSSKFADPTYAIETAPVTYNQGEALVDSAAWQNINAGKQSSAVYQYVSDRRLPAISYIGCQDTGVQAGTGGLGWRGIMDADAAQVAMAPGTGGVILWGTAAQYGGWASYRIGRWEDHGEFSPGLGFCLLSGSLMSPRSPFTLGLDDQCLAGVLTLDTPTTLSAAVTASTAAQAVSPVSMTGIVVGAQVTIDEGVTVGGTFIEETVAVSATTTTTFTAVFTKSHAAGATVKVNREVVARIAQSGIATKISQDFAPNGSVSYVAKHPSDPNVLYCVTTDQRVWRTTAGATAGPTTVWTEISTGRPPGVAVRSVAVNAAGEAFAIVQPITASGITTPLFLISGGTWVPQSAASYPSGSYARALADPTSNDVLYVPVDSRVYRATRAAGAWAFADISTGLPGGLVYDLWVANIGSTAAPKVLLRAAIPTRGIWELDVTAAATSPSVDLYLRDNILDIGWLNPSPDGVMSPYQPTEWVTHYQCADLKIDAQKRHTVAGGADYFQTDPEGTPIPPLNHTLFDQLKDNSQNLPQLDQAQVHVQVHNRSATASGSVSVWAIYCNASAGVPSLAASPSLGDAFAFWSQFGSGATITPSLPTDSPWKSVGPPRTISGLDAAHPQVATWTWTVPILSTGDPGHFCMVAFVHSASAPVGETSRMVVDIITPTNRQVGQKNLHIGPPLPPGPGPGSGSGSGGAPGDGSRMREYIEFHNPTDRPLRSDLIFDLRGLPPEISVSFLLTAIETQGPLSAALVGIDSSRRATSRDLPKVPIKPLSWPARPTGISVLAWIRWLVRALSLLWCMLRNIIRRLIGRPAKPCAPKGSTVVVLPTFEPVVYHAAPSALAGVNGVLIPPFGHAAAYITVEPRGPLAAGAEFRFEVQQRVTDREKQTEFFGGGTYVVTVTGSGQRGRPVFSPSVDPDTKFEDRQRFELDGERQRLSVLPPWMHEPVERAEREAPKE